MESCDSIKIETVSIQLLTNQLKDKVCQLNLHSCHKILGGVSLNRHNSSLIDTSSIAITHYNIEHTSILHKQSPITASTFPQKYGRIDFQQPITNNKASTLPKSRRVRSLWNLLQCSTIEPLFPQKYGRIDSQLPSLNWIFSYFGNFSQSTTCIATIFGECSSTLLDKLWYTYSYIYKPTTITIQYRLYIFSNSRWYTSPFWLLSSFKHTIPSASTPLSTTRSFTTHSTLQLLVLLESTSALSLPITLSTLFVKFIQFT